MNEDADALRTEGKLGRIFVYVLSIKDLEDIKAVDVVALQNAKKINVKHRYLNQNEVAFSGEIPSKYLVSGVDVNSAEKNGKAAENAKKNAKFVADKKGGLREWKQL